MVIFATYLLMTIGMLGGSRDALDRDESSDELGKRYYIYRDANSPGMFIPSGVMPDGNGVHQNTAEMDSPHSGKHCIRNKCELSMQPWVGVYFLLSGKWRPTITCNLFKELDAAQGDPIKCRFWARSKDRAIVQFKVGGVLEGKICDSLRFPAFTDAITLTPEWKMYEIDLTNKDLTSLVGGFMWACERANNGEKNITFDIDTIYFTVIKKPKTDH